MNPSELALAIATIAGVVITVIVGNRNVKKDIRTRIATLREDIRLRREEMHLMVGKAVLPRTLDALQTCFQYSNEIKSVLFSGMDNITENESDLRRSQNLSKLSEQLLTYREWYDQHCFYLPKDIREDFLSLLIYARKSIRDNESGKEVIGRDIWDAMVALNQSLESKIDSFMTKYSLFNED